MPNPIEWKTPDAQLTYEYDWSAEQTDGVDLVNVTHQAPFPLLVLAESIDAPNWRSFVRLGGGVHGQLYVPTAQAMLSTGELVTGFFTLRVMQ